ncbi:MAG: FKBP-type peptidyl-prolyl cis-trans isomerase [Nanoarchaeota archaeon]
MTLKKSDFIEIEFTGRTEDGEIFDSNIKEDLKKSNIDENKVQAKPFVFALGHDMFLKGIDEFLIGKPETQKEYEIELKPEKAFGKRDSKQIQMIPMNVFKEHNINPSRGAMFHFDGKVAKVISVSGGRVLVDFNNPLAGKNVIYKIKLLRKINNQEDKINSLNKLFFNQELEFEIKDKKLILKLNPQSSQLALMLKDKYKEILGLDLEVEEIKKETKKE